MIRAKNRIEVTNQNYLENRTYNLDSDVYANKLSVQVIAENSKGEMVYGPVIIQVTEGPEHTYEDELNTEQILELGFNSKGFVTPITGFRLRIPDLSLVPAVKPALINFTFYG